MKIYRSRTKLLMMVMTVLIVSLTCSAIVSAKKAVTLGSHFASPPERAAMEKLVELFEQTHPDIDCELISPAHEEYKTNIRMWLTTDNPPDVFSWFAGPRSIYFVEAGLTMDITDLWESKGYDNIFSPGWKSLCCYKGQTFMIPITHDWWAMYYRKSMFDKYGLTPPKTWDEFLDLCATLKAQGITPITIGTKYLWTANAWFSFLLTRTASLDFYSGLLAGEESYADIRVAKALELWKELIDKGYFLENHAAYTFEEAVPFMLRGEAAMYLMGNWWFDVVPDEVEPDMDFFQFPIIDPSVPVVENASLEGFIGAANAPHPEEALVLLDFLASKEGQELFAREFNRPTPNLNIPPEVYPPEVQKGIELIASADALVQYYDCDTNPEMADKGMNAFIEFMLNPDKAEEILIRLDEARKEIFGK